MAQDLWNPAQYKRFEEQRSQPFWDLAAKVDFAQAETMVDLGCGTGELTTELHHKVGLKRMIGIDSSAKMLEGMRSVETGVNFVQVKIEEFQPSSRFDVVFSNAALQWIENHQDLFPKILDWVQPGGFVAVQMPVNFDHPSHTLAGTVAERFGITPRQPPVLSADEYLQILWSKGFKDLDVSIKIYPHEMDSVTDVVEWTKGTLLTHYQKQLSAQDFAEFVAQYTEQLIRAVGLRRGEKYLYCFKRLFIIGRRPV